MAMESLRNMDRLLESVGVGISTVSALNGNVDKPMHLPSVPPDPMYVRKTDALNSLNVASSTQIPITSDDVKKLEDAAWLRNWHTFNVWVSEQLVKGFKNPPERKEWLLRHYPEYFELQTRAVRELTALRKRYELIKSIGAKTIQDLYFMFEFEKCSSAWQATLSRTAMETIGLLDESDLRDDMARRVLSTTTPYELGFYNPRARIKRGLGTGLAEMRRFGGTFPRNMGIPSTEEPIAYPVTQGAAGLGNRGLFYAPQSYTSAGTLFTNDRDQVGGVRYQLEKPKGARVVPDWYPKTVRPDVKME
jgi:hypothetical protein